MPLAAISYDIRPGHDREIAEIFAGFRRVGAAEVPGAPGTRLRSTTLFQRGAVMVRVIEYDGDLDAIARYIAGQPGVQEAERRLAPYLAVPRDTGTVAGFVETFRRSLLPAISRLTAGD
ncbi:SchA/CurD-like domain-containing protein [Actinokineospora enzanensis]|uniref:SchA/CurD-like domain-containing protein n=1 Tax=Actinokineospora enzanensis TaxID=155975 RepID=UPI0003604505|nr:SchA/CurD-like domain-containing protein [Actinokineospora enzanensis]